MKSKKDQDKTITKVDKARAMREVVNRAIEWSRNARRPYPLQEEIELRIAVNNLIKLGW